jgi:Flp pilus assembly pilin Flp
MLRKLWNDEAGFIISAELVLVATILVIGLIVGMVSLRNQIVQELTDVGQAIGSISQSFCFGGTWGGCGGTWAWTDSSCYLDKRDLCQADQVAGTPPGGVILTMWPDGVTTIPPGGELHR